MKERRYGLIGKKLDHSFSVDYFAKKFEEEGIQDARYEAFPLDSIQKFPELLQEHSDLIGLNVTIPYKELVIPYLDDLSDSARAIGAVNTIRLSKGKKEGFNTDAEGFEKEIQHLLPKRSKKAMILGTGGASKAVCHILEKLGYEVRYISRSGNSERIKSYDSLQPEEIRQQELIVNSTPLGTWPDTEEAPQIPYEGIASGTVLYDLIYNPSETTFLRKGKENGAVIRNGYGMLEEQAEAAWRIWNEHSPEAERIA